MLARLDGVVPEVSNLSDVWQMLYFETRGALEFYLACASQSSDGRVEKARAAVADGDKAVKILERIAARADPSDSWLFEDQKREKIRWFQAASEGIVFEATKDRRAKDAAGAFWNGIDQNYRQRYPAGPASHLAGIVLGVPAAPAIPEPSDWPRLVGVGFAAVAVLFLMVLVLISVAGKDISDKARPILVFLFALCCAMASGFLTGSLDLRGSVPFFGENPIALAAGGGLAVLIILIVIGNRAWRPHREQLPSDAASGARISKEGTIAGEQPSSVDAPLKEE